MEDELLSEELLEEEEAAEVEAEPVPVARRPASKSRFCKSWSFFGPRFPVSFSLLRRLCHDWVLSVQAKSSMALRIAVGYLICCLSWAHSS